MFQNKNRYIALRIKIIFSTLQKGKLSIKKIFNAIYCYLACCLRLKKTAPYPFVINFELTNKCNVNCLFCRSIDGDIYSQNPQDDTPIPKGEMPFELFTAIIDQVKDYLIMATLYLNGEPLLYKDFSRAVRYVSDRRIASMIATNGLLLDKRNIMSLLDAGLDFIKIAISGYTQKIYAIQHRKSNIERVKENIKTLVRLNNEGRYGLIIMLDYILYKYNAHELEAVRRFCDDLGIICNVRQGNLRGLEDKEPPLKTDVFDSMSRHCDWPWKILAVNWNGDIFPCCDYVGWSGSKPYSRFEIEKSNLANIWNGQEAIINRIVHLKKGRRAIPVCAICSRTGIAFKY